MSSHITVLATTIIGLLLGFSAPVAASVCTQKVLFSELFRNVNSDGRPSVNEVELCTKSVLVIQSDVPISEVVTNQSDAITVSPINRFTIIIHPVKEQEVVVSFFSGKSKEFIVLKIVESSNQVVADNQEPTPSLEGEVKILPVLVSDVNIKSEDLQTGDFVDVMLLSDQIRDRQQGSHLPMLLAREVKIVSISPNIKIRLDTNLDEEARRKLSWVFLALSSPNFSKVDGISATGSIILLQSKKSELYPAEALIELSENYKTQRVTDAQKAEDIDKESTGEIKTKSSINSVGTDDAALKTITIFRGTTEKRVKCNAKCSETDG